MTLGQGRGRGEERQAIPQTDWLSAPPAPAPAAPGPLTASHTPHPSASAPAEEKTGGLGFPGQTCMPVHSFPIPSPQALFSPKVPSCPSNPVLSLPMLHPRLQPPLCRLQLPTPFPNYSTACVTNSSEAHSHPQRHGNVSLPALKVTANTISQAGQAQPQLYQHSWALKSISLWKDCLQSSGAQPGDGSDWWSSSGIWSRPGRVPSSHAEEAKAAQCQPTMQEEGGLTHPCRGKGVPSSSNPTRQREGGIA